MKKNEDDKSKNEESPKQHSDKLVDEESEDSFPASDPPSWTLGEDEHK